MRRVLFLDVNGVLNSRCDYGMDGLGESHLSHLKRIVDESGCEIVLISSWRLAGNLREKLRRAFNQFSIPIWIDVTPERFDRAEEILAWLEENEHCIGVIVDDDYDGFDRTGLRFIQTSFAHGLTFELSSEIISAFEDQ